MTKHILNCFILLSIFSALIGCSGTTGFTADNKSPESTKEPFLEESELIQLADADMNCLRVGNEAGAYIISDRIDDQAAQLMYVDYKSGVYLPLCSSPNCTHDSDVCPSWYDNSDGTLKVFVLQDKLYLLHLVNRMENGEVAPGSLDVIELDGTERHELFRLKQGQSFMQTGILASQTAIFFNIQQIELSGETSKCITCRYNITEKELKEIRETESISEFIMGACGPYIVLKHIEVDANAFWGDKELNHQAHVLYAINQQGEKIEMELPQWEQSQINAIVRDGKLYTLEKETGSLYLTDLQSKEQKLLIKDEKLIGAKDFSHIAGAWDEGVILSIGYDPGPQFYEKFFLYNNGALLESTHDYLGNRSKKKNYIIASTKEFYLIYRDFMAPTFAIIEKEDYWNDLENDTDIKNIS